MTAAVDSAPLADLTPEQRQRLLEGGHVEAYAAGTILFREGEPGDAMFLVEEGEIQIFHQADGGEEIAQARVGPGQAFGEVALLEPDGRRSASARVLAAARLVRVTRGDLERAMGDDAPLARHLAERRDTHLLASLAARSTVVRALRGAPVRVTRRELTTGEVLARKGDPPGPAFVVVRGSVVLVDDSVDPPVVTWRVSPGSCVGERSVLEDHPRRSTLVAESPTTVLVVEADALRELVSTSAEWRAHVQALRRVYELPTLGWVSQFTGGTPGRETVVTSYDLPDGRRVLFSREVGAEWFSADVPGASVADRVGWSGPGATVELRLDATGGLVGADVRGPWAGLVTLVRHLLEDRLLLPGALARFERHGELDPPVSEAPADPLACACLVVPRSRVLGCIAEGARSTGDLQARLGCGSVCGGCVPGLAQLFGEASWTPATLAAREEVAPGVYALRIVPDEGARAPALAGQHVVLRVRVAGHPVERAYTLLAAESGDAYELGVKREPRGVLSRWLTGVALPARLEVSAPAGGVVLRDDMRSVVCLVAGIGVTPAVAVAREVAHRPLPTRVHIDYTARRRKDLAFGDELEALARAHPRITVRLRATAEEGRRTAEELRALVRAHPGAWYHLCGPMPFLVATREGLARAGVPDDRVLVEVFTPTGGPEAGRPAPIQATGGGEGEYADWSPDSPIFLAPRRLREDLRRAGQMAMRGGALLWQTVGRGFATSERVDRRLPTAPLGAARGFVFGLESFVLDHFEAMGAQAPVVPNPVDPYQPDGDTFVLFVPTPETVRGSPITTPWAKVAPEPVLAVHVVRGATATRAVLEDADRFDRGPLPFHYNQQLLGAAGTPPPGHDSAGLAVGRYHANPRWREDRDLGLRALVPALLEEAAAELPDVIGAPFDALARRVADRPDEPLDAHRFTSRLALRMVLSVLFGATALPEVERAAAPVADLARGMTDFVEDLMARRAGAREVVSAHARGLAAVRGIRAAVERAQPRMPEAERTRPWVRALLDAPTDDAGLERVYTAVLPLLVAGHETTGTIMAWALYVLARDPELQARVTAEVDRWRAERPGTPVGLLAQTHRPETLSLLFELYRRYPPVAQTMRTALVDGEIPPDPATGIGAFRYRADAVMMVSIVAIHRDPRWWSDPERFDPTRFTVGVDPGAPPEERGRAVRAFARSAEEANRFIPFLRGPSGCIGRGLNQVEFFAFLDAFLARWTVVPADPTREVDARGTSISGPPPGAIALLLRPR